MATQFENAIASAVGTTASVVYTCPVDKKSILIGCNVANVTGAILPVSLILRQDSAETYIVKNLRVGNGESVELMKGNKLVLQAGDELLAVSADSAAFDVIASILVGVT